MLLFERQCKTIDDRAQNFEQLSNAVEALGLISELEEDVVDRPSDVRSQVQEFAIYSVQSGLEKISLPWIFRIEQLEKLNLLAQPFRHP